MQSLKVTLRIVPWVSVPIFKAESRECSTQFVMVIFSHTPYRRDMGPVDFTTMASSPVETMQLAITTLRQQSGSMPSLLAPRSSFRIFIPSMRTFWQPAICSVQKAASFSVTSRTVKFSTSSNSIMRGRNASQVLGHSWKPLSSFLSKNTWSPWP